MIPGKLSILITIFIGSIFSFIFAQDKSPWWNHSVFYEIFVRSFYDSDDDGIGDLQGLTQKLDYLNDGDPATTTDLGITGIWLMPISQSPSYHGYDVTDYRNVEENYGSLDDFETLIDSAHARGIKVIIDLVLNHSSSQHPWFINSASGTLSPYRDWYTWSPNNPGYQGPWGQQVWHYRNGAYYFGLFWSGMPDLNYGNDSVKTEMFDVARFWLDTMRVDGFRLDAIKHLFEDGTQMENVPQTFTFLEEFRTFYKGVNQEALTVGEVWSTTDQIALYSDGTKVDFCFEFGISYAIINAVKSGNPNRIITEMEEVISSYPPLQYAPFLTNHDQNRVFEEFSRDNSKMKLAAAVYLTLPGIPFIYYGEEIGMVGSGRDENKRTPMQWTAGPNAGFSNSTPWHAINSDYVDVNVTEMQQEANSLWHWYQKLIAVRNENESLRSGHYTILSTSVSNLYAFARPTESEMTVVLHNFRNDAVQNPVLSINASSLNPGDYSVTDLINNETIGTLTIADNGSFTGWRPEIEIPAQGTVLLRIGPVYVTADRDNKRNQIPETFELAQNFPNPFNPVTRIRYNLVKNSYVILDIYDLLGRKMKNLVDQRKEPGYYSVQWDGTDDVGQQVSAGLYFYTILAGEYSQTRKMIFLR